MDRGTGEAAQIARPTDVTPVPAGFWPAEPGTRTRRFSAIDCIAAVYASPVKRPDPEWNRPSEQGDLPR